MKTKIFISKLRAVAEVAALVVLVILILVMLMLIIGYHVVQDILFRFWPIVAGISVAYSVLSLAEDYLNHRIFRKYLQFT